MESSYWAMFSLNIVPPNLRLRDFATVRSSRTLAGQMFVPDTQEAMQLSCEINIASFDLQSEKIAFMKENEG